MSNPENGLGLNLPKVSPENQNLENQEVKTVKQIPNYTLAEKTKEELEQKAGRELTKFENQFLEVSNQVVRRANEIMVSDSDSNNGFSEEDKKSFEFIPASQEIEAYSANRENYYSWLEYLDLKNRILIEDIVSNPDSEASQAQIETFANMLAKSMAENQKQLQEVADLLNNPENQELLNKVSRVFQTGNQIAKNPEDHFKYVSKELKKLGIEGLKVVLDLDRTVTAMEIGGYNELRPTGEVENDVHKAVLVDRPSGLVGCTVMHGSNLMHPNPEIRERAKNLYYQAGRNANLVADGTKEFFEACNQKGVEIYADTANLEPMGLGILHSIDPNFDSKNLIGIKGGIDFRSLNKSIEALKILLIERKIPMIADDGHGELVDELEGKGFLREISGQVLDKPLSFENFSLVIARDGDTEKGKKKCKIHEILAEKGVPHVTYTDDMTPVAEFINGIEA